LNFKINKLKNSGEVLRDNLKFMKGRNKCRYNLINPLRRVGPVSNIGYQEIAGIRGVKNAILDTNKQQSRQSR